MKNIIFDLGGVILDIDFKVTQHEFVKLGMNDIENTFSQFNQVDFFDQYDRGEINDSEFIANVKKLLPSEVTSQQITDAWNAMLFELPEERFRLMKRIASNYRIFLMSNTNGIHFTEYQRRIQKQFDIPDLDSLFEKAYYSFKDGMRKPEERYFNRILEENKLAKSETVFIDDTVNNTSASESYGIKGILLSPPMTLADIFTPEGYLKAI